MPTGVIPRNIMSIIGGGNIARSMATGLIGYGYQRSWLRFSSTGRDKEKAALLQSLGIEWLASNCEAAEQADILILAVKPAALKQVCEEIAPVVQRRNPLVVSLVTGIGSEQMLRWLQAPELAIVRTMTNIAMSISKGTTALHGNPFVTPLQRELVNNIFSAVGSAYWLDTEEELNTITPLIGCNAASLYLMIEAIQNAAIASGVDAKIAPEITLQTLEAAIELLKLSGQTPEQLRAQITTPKGVTYTLHEEIASVLPLYQSGYRAAVAKCREIEAAWRVDTSKVSGVDSCAAHRDDIAAEKVEGTKIRLSPPI